MAIDAETTRLMNNWAMWRCGASISCAISGAYDAALKDSYDTPMPLINGEAMDVEAAVDRMEQHLQQAVVEFWVKPSSTPVADKARRCGCSSSALYRRLDQAHAFVHAYFRQLRERAERVRSALCHSHCQNASDKRETGRIIPLPLQKLRTG